MAIANTNLRKAKAAKNDEFYTQLNDVANELKHYRHHFKGKTVFCNCDDPTWSAFWKYFHLNFEVLGLKKLISTHYDATKPTYKMEYTGGDDNDIEVGVKTPLEGNGDFRNVECIELLKESDIVVTNPPFSQFREYVAQLIEYDKEFLIIGNPNAVTYKEIFPLIKNNQMWIGAKPWSHEMYFGVPKEQEEYLVKNKKEGSAYVIRDGEILGRAATLWFTNLDIEKRHEKLILWKKYTLEEFPKYDNYMAWNVNKVADIFVDEDIEVTVDNEELEQITKAYGSDAAVIETDDDKTRVKIHHPVMGVPITFLDKYNPDQFTILGSQRWCKDKIILDAYCGSKSSGDMDFRTIINGKETYDRIFIRKNSVDR